MLPASSRPTPGMETAGTGPRRKQATAVLAQKDRDEERRQELIRKGIITPFQTLADVPKPKLSADLFADCELEETEVVDADFEPEFSEYLLQLCNVPRSLLLVQQLANHEPSRCTDRLNAHQRDQRQGCQRAGLAKRAQILASAIMCLLRGARSGSLQLPKLQSPVSSRKELVPKCNSMNGPVESVRSRMSHLHGLCAGCAGTTGLTKSLLRRKKEPARTDWQCREQRESGNQDL